MASQQARSVCSPPVLNAVKFRAHRLFDATVPFGRTRRLFLVTAPSTLAIGGWTASITRSPSTRRAKQGLAGAEAGRRTPVGPSAQRFARRAGIVWSRSMALICSAHRTWIMTASRWPLKDGDDRQDPTRSGRGTIEKAGARPAYPSAWQRCGG